MSHFYSYFLLWMALRFRSFFVDFSRFNNPEIPEAWGKCRWR